MFGLPHNLGVSAPNAEGASSYIALAVGSMGSAKVTQESRPRITLLIVSVFYRESNF